MSKNAGKPFDQRIITDMPSSAISFDNDATDGFIRSQGVQLVHYRAIRCPVGMTDLDDNRRPHEDHAGCSNGFIYKKVGTVTTVLQGNSNPNKTTDVGFVDGASFYATFARCYDDLEEKVRVAPYDRFYLVEENVLVPNWQLFLAHQTGEDRLNFPAVKIEHLIDARGIEYTQNEHFIVNGRGQIEWLTENRPGIDLETGRGTVCSVRYHYKPFLYVGRILHEIRLSQADNPITGERGVEIMPQQAVVHREFMFLNEQKDEFAKDSDSLRQQSSPIDGGFGPR